MVGLLVGAGAGGGRGWDGRDGAGRSFRSVGERARGADHEQLTIRGSSVGVRATVAATHDREGGEGERKLAIASV